REWHYLFQVKQIEDFFERFNFLQQSPFYREFRKRNRTIKFSRADFIKSVFDAESKAVPPILMDEFIKQVTQNNQYLYFNDNNWYAEAVGLFSYDKKLIPIPIVLQCKYNYADSSYKWMVINVKLPASLMQNQAVKFSSTKNYLRFIAPSSHATNFISLPKAFVADNDFASYFDDAFLRKKSAAVLYGMLKEKKLQMVTVQSVTYHFWGIDNWIFTVNNQMRSNLNSGWLITSLQKATQAQKQQYINQLIY
ncbi:MAG: hypothetical protein ACOVNR_09520, partial [Chitinophagaceae bacterium]